MGEWIYCMKYARERAQSTRLRHRVFGFRYSHSGRWGYAVEPVGS